MKTMVSIAVIAAATPLCQVATADPQVHNEEIRIAFPAVASSEEIYGTILRKARRGCATRAIRPHVHMAKERACREQFIEEVVGKIDDPELTARHLEQTANQPLLLAESKSN